MFMRRQLSAGAALLLLASLGAACGGNNPPIVRPTPPEPPSTAAGGSGGARPPAPPEPVVEPPVATAPVIRDEGISSGSLDEINRNSPLRPVYYDLDSSELNAEGRRVLDANAAVMRQNGTWTVTIEGHCDERGTAEYNLALGERRALAARAYLVSVGLPSDRIRTVSYGKEFPFDPGRDEAAFAKNRRAHFVVTAK
jgi:peptidoglycan-associated lipoprotein